MKAALYLRISQDQTGQSLGVTRQQEDCADLAKQLGWDITPDRVFIDNDVSATSGKTRPAYKAMLAAMDAGDVEAVVAWHPDRLYRKIPDLGDLIDVCKRNNAQIATVKAGNIDLTTPTGRLVAGLLAQVATYEGEAKSDRWLRSVRQRREAGVWAFSGPRLYGYTRDGEIVEEEAEVIRWMAAEVADGCSINSLANQLEARGILTSQGNAWQAASLRRLLINPRLAGYATLSRVVTAREPDENGVDRLVKRRVTDIIARGQHEPILDDDTFQAVRALITARARQRPARPRVAVLVGLVHCGACGARMITGARMRKTGRPDLGTRRIYRCSAAPGIHQGCGKMSGFAEEIEEVVEEYARHRLNNPAVRARIMELSRTTPTGYSTEIRELDDRIRELEGELDEPGIPVATILRAIDRAKERLETLLGNVSTMPPRRLPEVGSWPTDLGQRRALIDIVVERVTIQPGTPGAFNPERVEITPR